MQTPTPTGCPARAATPSEPIVVLRPVGQTKTCIRVVNGSHALETRGSAYSCTLYRANLPDIADGYHPAQWWGSETRRDNNGVQWRGPARKFVMDDFGYLVPVGGAA